MENMSVTQAGNDPSATPSGTHTPEPWWLYNKNKILAINDGLGTHASNDVVAWTGFDSGDKPWKTKVANARRIVACVNACKGIPTKDLARWGVSLIDVAPDQGSVRNATERGTPTYCEVNHVGRAIYECTVAELNAALAKLEQVKSVDATREEIEAYRKDSYIFQEPPEPAWVTDENRILNAICDAAIRALPVLEAHQRIDIWPCL